MFAKKDFRPVIVSTTSYSSSGLQIGSVNCQLSRSRPVLSDLEKRPRKWQARLVAKSRSQTEPASRPALGLLLTFLLSPTKDILHTRLGDADVAIVVDLSC